MEHVLSVTTDTELQNAVCASFGRLTPPCQVTRSADADHAQDILQTDTVDILIVDGDLTDPAKQRLLQLASPSTPVILLVTTDSSGMTETGLDDETVDYVHKGLTMQAELPGRCARLYKAWQTQQQLHMAETELDDLQARFDAITGNSSDFIWEIDETGTYTYVSPQVQNLLGYLPGEIIGRSSYDFMPAAEAERLRQKMDQVRQSGRPIRAWENTLRHKDGRLVFMETSGAPTIDEDGHFRGFRGIDRDITARHHAEQIQNRRDAILQAVAVASQKLLQPASSLNDTQDVLALLGEAAEASRVYVFANSSDDQGQLLTSQLFEWSAPGVSSELQNRALQNLPFSPDYSRWAAELGEQRLIVGRVQDFPPSEQTLLSSQEILSILVVPIFVGEAWWGFIGLDDCWQERVWASQEIDAIQTAARLLGAALHRQQWESKLTQMNECFLRFGPDPMTNINLVTTLCGKLFGATSAYYCRRDGDRLCQWGAFRPMTDAASEPAAGQICLDVIEGEQELYLPDLKHTQYADADPLILEYGLQTYYGRPVRHVDETVGALSAVFQYHYQPTDDDRNLMAIMATAIGVEEDRRHAELELRRLAITVEQAAESICILDTEGRIEYVNPAFEAASGFSKAELVGQGLPLFRSALHDKEFYRNIWRTLRKGEIWSNRIANRRKDGSIYHEDAVISPIRDHDNRITNFVAVKRDISKELELEEQLRHSQKMESVGRLAGGVAHDFNNLLSVIMGYADMTLSNLPTDHPLHDMVMEIRKAGERATSLTQQLLAFSRKQVLEVKSVNLNQVIEDMRKMLSRLIGEQIALETHLDPTIYHIRADVAQLQQILMNLLINARDAIEGSGTITIETCNEFIPEDDPRIGPELESAEYVVLIVSDNGHGIDETTMERIFDPFYTTKSRGKGTGLGLATVHGIVKQHRGDILVHSEVGQGTEFHIYFPSEQAGKEIGDTTIEDAVEPHGTETILLVEDDFNVLSLATRILEKYGYEVLPADSPEVALRKIDQYSEPIHLLLTDVVMPRMNGPELYAHLRETLPDLRVLYMSGYTESSLRGRGIIDTDHLVLSKPFSISALTESVRMTLDE